MKEMMRIFEYESEEEEKVEDDKIKRIIRRGNDEGKMNEDSTRK